MRGNTPNCFRFIPIYIGVLFASFFGPKTYAQIEVEQDSSETIYYIIEGDTIVRDRINLDEVFLLPRLEFKSEKDRRQYLLLKRKTRKVYPYAKLAAERLTVMTERINALASNRQKRIYTKRLQNYIENEFSETIRNLTHSEGQILVKLIYRQTGHTAYDLVKDLRTGWRAFWYNVTANMFEISLKETYNPFEVIEDYLIEDILERAFREEALERQAPAVPISFVELREYWNNKNVGK